MSKSRRQAISASYLSHQGDQLTFVSRFRPRQQSLSLTLNVGDGDLRLEVLLKQARETHNGDFICQGQVVEGLDLLNYPQVPQTAAKYARLATRTSARLRALSPELPGFKALSLDMSLGGLRLETEDKLMPGSRIKMSLDLDIPDQDPVPLNCRVVWCQQIGRSYLVGMQFVDLEPWVPPLLDSFQLWLQGSGLKPRPYKPLKNLEFPEPVTDLREEPRPPAGSISNVSFAQGQVDMVLTWTRGEVFRVVFDQVLIFRDDRGIEGAAFYDAVDLEDSKLMIQAKKVQPVSLDQESSVFHYQFLNRNERSIFEIVCLQPADYQLIKDES